MLTYQGSGAEARKGDVVHVAPEWVRYYGNLGGLDGVIVRMARDGLCDVRYYVGPGTIFPDITHRTRRIPVHRLLLVQRAKED